MEYSYIGYTADKRIIKGRVSAATEGAAEEMYFPYFTTLAGANSFSLGLRALRRETSFRVMPLQEYHQPENRDCRVTTH